jgi:hypothetical protein
MGDVVHPWPKQCRAGEGAAFPIGVDPDETRVTSLAAQVCAFEKRQKTCPTNRRSAAVMTAFGVTGGAATECKRICSVEKYSSSLLKNLEMGVFLFLPVVVLGWRVDLDVIFQPGVGRPLTRGG